MTLFYLQFKLENNFDKQINVLWPSFLGESIRWNIIWHKHTHMYVYIYPSISYSKILASGI